MFEHDSILTTQQADKKKGKVPKDDSSDPKAKDSKSESRVEAAAAKVKSKKSKDAPAASPRQSPRLAAAGGGAAVPPVDIGKKRKVEAAARVTEWRTVIVPGRTVKVRPDSEGLSGCWGCEKWT